MKKDLVLEKIKKGDGLKTKTTSNVASHKEGITKEKRIRAEGIRLDMFSKDKRDE